MYSKLLILSLSLAILMVDGKTKIDSGLLTTVKESKCAWAEYEHENEMITSYTLRCQCLAHDSEDGHSFTDYGCEYKGDMTECSPQKHKPVLLRGEMLEYFKGEFKHNASIMGYTY